MVDEAELRAVDVCLVLGGDGTILRTLGRLMGSGVPTLGVNFGNVGFLAALPRVGWDTGLEAILAGDSRVIELLTVDVQVNGRRHTAVNDVILSRVAPRHVLQLEYEVAGVTVGKMFCDGLIIASPTGSSAYNLSCGGPIVEWDAGVLVLNFIAPHSLGFRPVILRPDHVISARNVSPLQEAKVVVDGVNVGRLCCGDDVLIAAGEQHALLMVRSEGSFYQNVEESSSTAAMLAELSINDLVLIAEARLAFSPGLNVITGETGAGKTLLAQAIGLLMGQKGGDELVRPGAQRALVQALFESPDETLAVARELPRGGRSEAHMNGLLSSAAAVEDALRSRLAFYGELEHARLLQLERQLDLLDGAAAEELAPLLDAYATAYAQARTLSRELRELVGAGREREREIDMLRFQVGEIEAAEVQPCEDERLARERERLRHAGKLLERAAGALSLLGGETESAALDAVRVAQRLVGEAAALDDALGPAAERLDGLAAELDDLCGALRAYLDDLEVDPAQRDAMELRYDKLKSLMRKYGGSADEVLAYAEQARQRLCVLEDLDAGEEQLTARAGALRAEALAAAAQLSAARHSLAPRVAARVEEELRGLAMPHATFTIVVAPRGEGWDALGPRGADEAEFLFSANPGVPPRPLRETASGGELSRAMLAIRGIVTLGDDVETLIFDEVDTGIGGVTAAALGERLARLAERRQVLCITHLPQVAVFAERQFAIVKESDPAAGSTVTVVRRVEGDDRLAELCRMLGAAPSDSAARSHVQGLLARARRAD